METEIGAGVVADERHRGARRARPDLDRRQRAGIVVELEDVGDGVLGRPPRQLHLGPALGKAERLEPGRLVGREPGGGLAGTSCMPRDNQRTSSVTATRR